MILRIRKDAVSPQHYPVRVDTSVTGLDLNDCSSVTIHVRKPDGTEDSWVATITDQDTDFVEATYFFQAGDLDQVGAYAVWLELEVTYAAIDGPWLTDTTNTIEVFE